MGGRQGGRTGWGTLGLSTQPFPRASCNAPPPLLSALRADLLNDLWSKASSHRGGTGLQTPSADIAANFIQSLRKQGELQAAGALQQAAAGGMWPRDRRATKGMLAERFCQHCGAEVEDEFHLLWECEVVNKRWVERGLGEELDGTRRVALRIGRADPAFWTRGLAPRPTLKAEHAPPTQQQHHQLPAGPWEPAAYFTDASGGKYTTDPTLRRVGFGSARLPDPFCQ